MRHKPLTFTDKEMEIIDAMEQKEEFCKKLREAQAHVKTLQKERREKHTIKAICNRLGVEFWQVIKVWY